MPVARGNGINIYYEVHGDGDPLVLIQCLGGNSVDWQFQTPVFAERYRVVIFDNRGSGRSEAPPPRYSVVEMADDALALMDVLGIERAHILGLSLGGFIAQELALRSPQRVDRLVLAATAARLPALSRHALRVWLRMAEERVSEETRFLEMFSWLFSSRLLEDESQVATMLGFFVQNPYPQLPEGYSGQIAACLAHDTRHRIKAIAAPTLVMAAGEDILVPVAAAEELASGIPRARLAVIPGGGHAFGGELPDQFNRAVLEFLAGP